MKFICTILFLIFSICGISAQDQYRILSEKAISYIEQDSLEQAEVLLKEAMKLEPANPYNALLFSNLGLIQKQMGKYENAIESYTYAVNLAPTTLPIIMDRAALFLELGMTDQAYRDYVKVLDIDKNNKEALLMRAYIHQVRRDYGLSRADYMQLLKLDPSNYNARLGLVTLEQKELKFREALEQINKLILEYPEDAVLYVARADVEREMEHIDLALTDLDEAIRLNPSSIDAYLLRGDIYLMQGRKHLAKLDFERAIRLGVPTAQLSSRLSQCK